MSEASMGTSKQRATRTAVWVGVLVFVVGFDGESDRTRDISKVLAPKDVAIFFRADGVVAVVNAGKYNFVQTSRAVGVIQSVADFEHLVRVGVLRNEVHESKFFGADEADDFLGKSLVVEVFHTAKAVADF